MTLAIACLIFARLVAGGAVPPGRLESACRTVQSEAAAQGWSSPTGTWAPKLCHWDEWTAAGEWSCNEQILLVRGDELLAQPCTPDSLGAISVMEVWTRIHDVDGCGTITFILHHARVADDARRRVLVRELVAAGVCP